jgi:alkylation response protein AidB-like acyl-CoA dehydrogenase
MAGPSPFYSEEHCEFRALLDRFVEKEVTPFVNEWDEAGEFPLELYAKAADVGILGAGFPEEYDGSLRPRSPNEAAAPTWPGCAPRRNETATTERPATVLLAPEVGGLE